MPTVRARLAAVAAVLAVVAACSPNGGDASTEPSPSPTPIAAGSDAPGPRATAWPTPTIQAAKTLGAAHNEFQEIHADILVALDSEDPARIHEAMDHIAEFLEGVEAKIPELQEYEGTKALGDALASAYRQMIDGAKQVSAGLETGDGPAVEAGFETFFAGTAAYVAVSGDLALAAERAMFMERVLVR